MRQKNFSKQKRKKKDCVIYMNPLKKLQSLQIASDHLKQVDAISIICLGNQVSFDTGLF